MAKTIRMMALMQESSLSKSQIIELEKKSKALYQKYFGEQYRLLPVWMVIPHGQCYIAAKPSTTTTVTIPVADNTSNDIRHAYMAEYCEMWMNYTRCHINEIIFNAPDQSTSDQFMKIQLERFHPKKRTRELIKLAFKLIKSKIFNGYLSASINLNR